MKCPSCGSDKAYIGLNVVECGNIQCKHWKPILIKKIDMEKINRKQFDKILDGLAKALAKACNMPIWTATQQPNKKFNSPHVPDDTHILANYIDKIKG